MSQFFDLVSKPARSMGVASVPLTSQTAFDCASRLIKLDANESPFGPSSLALEAMREVLGSSNIYPEDECRRLRLKLAAHHHLQPQQILVTAGSTAMLSLLCQTLLAPGMNAVTSERSFIVYSIAVQAAGATLIEAPMRKGISGSFGEDTFDLEAILAAIDSNTRIVFIANPNNPTGTLIEANAIEDFLARVPSHVVVVLDEAYYEFAVHFSSLRRLNYPISLDYVRRDLSVVVLRTFSKAHGLAALRVGYGLGPAELLEYCARMRNTFSVSSVAQAAASAALDDRQHVHRVVENNAIQSRDLSQGLTALGYRITPTAANFLFCDVGERASDFASRLEAEGVAVRPLASWGAPTCVRITIGRAEQNRALLQAAKRVRSAAESQADFALKSPATSAG